MTYNKYIAPAGKVLFNTENFTYGNTILSVHDLNLIILDEKEAEKLYQEYLAKENKINEERNKEQASDEANNEAVAMVLNEDGVYEEESRQPLLDFRKEKLIELMAKGVNLSPKINKLKLNTEHI